VGWQLKHPRKYAKFLVDRCKHVSDSSSREKQSQVCVNNLDSSLCALLFLFIKNALFATKKSGPIFSQALLKSFGSIWGFLHLLFAD